MGGVSPNQGTPFSFDVDVVLVGVPFFVMNFLAPPDFHVQYVHVLVCPCIYLSVCVCACVCVCVWWGGGGGVVGGSRCVAYLCLCVCASALSCNGESEL